MTLPSFEVGRGDDGRLNIENQILKIITNFLSLKVQKVTEIFQLFKPGLLFIFQINLDFCLSLRL